MKEPPEKLPTDLAMSSFWFAVLCAVWAYIMFYILQGGVPTWLVF